MLSLEQCKKHLGAEVCKELNDDAVLQIHDDMQILADLALESLNRETTLQNKQNKNKNKNEHEQSTQL